MAWIRWLGSSLLASVTALAHALLIAAATIVPFPDLVRHYHGMFRDEPVTGAALRSALEWGSFAAMFMGPLMGFTLVRDFNAVQDKPQPTLGWWRFVVRDIAWTF